MSDMTTDVTRIYRDHAPTCDWPTCPACGYDEGAEKEEFLSGKRAWVCDNCGHFWYGPTVCYVNPDGTTRLGY